MHQQNTHAALHKYGDVCQQMHENPSLQRLHLQAEQSFWGFNRCQVKHILQFKVLNTL